MKTEPADWDRAFEAVLGQHGRLDILVNNAGRGGHIAPLTDLTDADILQTITVMCRASVNVRPGRGDRSILRPKPAWGNSPTAYIQNCANMASA